MEPGRKSGSGESAHQAWARALTRVGIVAVLVLSALYVFKSLRDLPGDAVDKGRQVLADLETVAAAFQRGTIETTFIGHATRVSGSNFLQVATLHQMEVYTRQDGASILWGQLELPEVVVSATAPVEYTYYLDLNEEWVFRLDEQALWVHAPSIRFNQPAIDASGIRYEVETSSLLRDEEEALRQLKRGLTEMSLGRAQENVELIRELGRSKTREFVENWLAGTFVDGPGQAVRVVFPDERQDLQVPSPRG